MAGLSHGGSTRAAEIGIIVGTCVAAVITVIIVALTIVRWRNKARYQKLKKRASGLMGKATPRKTKKTYSFPLEDMDDTQRQAIIQKSLVSRTSSSLTIWPSRTDSALSSYRLTGPDYEGSYTSDQRDSLDEEEFNVGIKEDWKEWEARLQRHRSVSIDRHPAMGHPAMSHPAMRHSATSGPYINHPAMREAPISQPAISHPAFSSRKDPTSSSTSYLLAKPQSRHHVGHFSFETLRDPLYSSPRPTSFGAAFLPPMSHELSR